MHRRHLLQSSLLAAGAPFLGRARQPSGPSSTFLPIVRAPDYVTAFSSLNESFALSRTGEKWTVRDIAVTALPGRDTHGEQLSIMLTSPRTELVRLHLRWLLPVASSLTVLGDAWERSYGELAWRTLVPDRVMPWYFATYDGKATHGYGVKTAPSALCFWQLDPHGVSLWLDVSNGGNGVSLGERQLHAATVVAVPGENGQNSVETVKQFCRCLCDSPRLSRTVIYGSNDWYYAYGKNTAAQSLRDAELVGSLSEGNLVRPFTVIDMGWEGNLEAFPDMAKLAQEMKGLHVRPGLWVRPLQAPDHAKASLLLPAARFGKLQDRASECAYDPTVPEALEIIKGKIRQTVAWNYDLIKHDFSTYDLLGRWRNEMGAQPTLPGWSLHDRTRTNAEVIRDLYTAIRSVAEKQVLIGCNTVGHISAGLFEAQRTGDDTSGRIWERTRRMGVNTLAFRMPQHQTFFAVDADCVGITNQIPWQLNRQWLDVLTRSGTTLFVSPGPDATGAEQRKALRDAFAIASSGNSAGAPTDWFHNTTPDDWQFTHPELRTRYRWLPAEGAWPFSV